MSIGSWINQDNMLRDLMSSMNEEMQAAAEPVIRKAVEEAEKKMRRSLATMFVAIIDRSFSIERMGNDIRILVKYEKGD